MRPPLRLVPWVRPAVYRPGRRVTPKRERGIWTWRGTLAERAEAWLWDHPKTEAFLGGLLVALMVGALAYLVWAVPEARP